MTSSAIVLEGCTQSSLVGYLKALGVFRLVALQADQSARGWWEHERFHLATVLSQQELHDFLLQTYQPTPVISPWNAGSGFYYREEKAKKKDLTTGKRAKTGVRNQPTEATRALDILLDSKAPRLLPYRQAIRAAQAFLLETDRVAAPADDKKVDLIRTLRSRMPDAAIDWIDAAATVTQTEVVFPPLLGSGGNDGNLDFSTTFIQRIAQLIDAESGSATETSAALLAAAIQGEVARAEGDLTISQFAPGAIGAPNSTTGFVGPAMGNSWDIVLSLEGTLMMATALVRRVETRDGAASFPFMLSRRGVFGAGAGNIAPADENARGEFWAPAWGRPAAFAEILALFREGRAVVDRATARNALDFARAIGRLGVDRGIKSFERYGFEQRNGNMYLGVRLERRRVEPNPRTALIADLTRDNWLELIRSAVRGRGAPASLLALGYQLDEALFRLAGSTSTRAVQDTVVAIGALAMEAGRRPKIREAVRPPRLSAAWLPDADDGSDAFAIARALATLDSATSVRADARFHMPFRRHLAPLEVRDAGRGRDAWTETTETKALAVWTGRDGFRDMTAVLGRRLVEAERRAFVRIRAGTERAELPLVGWRVSLAVISAFVAGELDAEIDRIIAIAAGLAWVVDDRRDASPAETKGVNVEKARVCGLAFAALKPLFDPKGIAVPRPWSKDKPRWNDEDDHRERKPVNPLPIVRLVEAGRVPEAISMAMRMARAAGLNTPFAREVDDSQSVRGLFPTKAAARLAAALLIPLSDPAIEALANRAYPVTTSDQEENE